MARRLLVWTAASLLGFAFWYTVVWVIWLGVCLYRVRHC
jgi:hypothetical protein